MPTKARLTITIEVSGWTTEELQRWSFAQYYRSPGSTIGGVDVQDILYDLFSGSLEESYVIVSQEMTDEDDA